MILAAGLGTRLRPLTYDVPKALVEVGGEPVIDRVARRVVAAGADRIVVNVSPHADRIRAHIDHRDGWGVDVRVSEEPDGPLETGGGLKHAASLFRGDRPILVHNADILTDIDLAALYRAHADATAAMSSPGQDGGSGPLATLAVRPAESDRYLMFDDDGMSGYAYDGREYRARQPRGRERPWDFLGVHAVSPRLLSLMEEEGKFSLFTPLMRLIARGERVAAFDGRDARWTDIGTHEDLAAAQEAWG